VWRGFRAQEYAGSLSGLPTPFQKAWQGDVRRRRGWKGGDMFSSRWLGVVVLAVPLGFSANSVSSRQAQQLTEIFDERTAVTQKRVEVAEITGKSAAACSIRLQGFIEELEGVLSWAHSVYPVQRLFEKYFPLEGCDPDAVSELCLKSRYCRAASIEPNIMVIEFDSRWDHPRWGLHVQFGLDMRSGDSRHPFVKLKDVGAF
jgi:hypothetical protein